MRIISGKAKGLTIKAPKGQGTRPTSDKVREAIFSSLGDKVINAKVLDLYAGSGALGIEAISRGADRAIFIDSSYNSFKIIKKNVENLGFEEQAKVVRKKVEVFLEKLDTRPFKRQRNKKSDGRNSNSREPEKQRAFPDLSEQTAIARDDTRFDLIFIDAPYKIGLANLDEVISLALEALKENGLLIVEYLHKKEVAGLFNCSKTKKYGQTKISYLEKS